MVNPKTVEAIVNAISRPAQETSYENIAADIAKALEAGEIDGYPGEMERWVPPNDDPQDHSDVLFEAWNTDLYRLVPKGADDGG